MVSSNVRNATNRKETAMTKSDTYYNYPNAGWWHSLENMAKGMQASELEYSRLDSFQAATKGVECNYGKYMDENSIYVREINKRSAK